MGVHRGHHMQSATMQQTRSIHTTSPQVSKPQVCPAPRSRPASKQHRAFSSPQNSASKSPDAASNDSSTSVSKRQLLSGTTAAVLAAVTAPTWQQQQPAQAQSLDDDFTITSSGLKVLDVRPGEGATPQPGDTVVVHWSGYTKGYQVCNMLAAPVATGGHMQCACIK